MPAASPERTRGLPTSRWKRLWTRLVAVVVIIVGLGYAFLAFVDIRTNVLWFRSVHIDDVYGTIVGAQILLFCVFGGLAALAAAASLFLLIRNRPAFRPDPTRQVWRHRYLRFERHFRLWLIVLIALYFGVHTGTAASGRWQTYVMWRNAETWHRTDSQFHRDISYYVSVLPFHEMVIGYLSSIVLVCLALTLIGGYLYGALQIRTRGRSRRTTPAFKAQVSVLLGIFLLLEAGSFWLSRYQLTTSNRGPVTGLSYTDIHAALPARTMLTVIALLCALLLFANVRLGRVRYLVLGVATLYVASFLLNSLWPSLVHRYREQPSAATLDRTTIERNQAATLSAFGLEGKVKPQAFGGGVPPARSAAQVKRTAQVRLLDPNQLSPTFNVKQELQAYYRFKDTLDIDNYGIDGVDQDVAIAARELNLEGIPRQTWANKHLVYTHGFGVVAAPTNRMDEKTGTPDFINGGLPPQNTIPVDQPRIYFGQDSPRYSIVGQPEGSKTHLEFDFPSSGSQGVRTTYTGDGGVPIGSRFNRFLYAVDLHDANIFFSSDINSASRLLSVRDPRERVAKVAPWLTLDGDVYPAIVDGQVEWVVDGYTSSAHYPEAQQINLHTATTSSLTQSGASIAQPNREVNYLQNSVKAVVNAYTGKVSLYEWNQDEQPDPLLKTWENAFPGLVKPESDIPADLLRHLRYPQDLFDVQRLLLTQYHVTDPGDFYNGNAFWKIPNDPTVSATHSLNESTGKSGSNPTMPSVYMSLAPTGEGPQEYSLSTPMVTLNYRDLAAFLSVNATPGPDYGTFTLLEFPSGQQFESPTQIQNDVESDNTIAKALTLQRGGNSRVVLGNLLTIPVAGKVLYVEPVYTKAQGNNSFPILRHVIAVYGDGQPAFEPTLTRALDQAIANDARAG